MPQNAMNNTHKWQAVLAAALLGAWAGLAKAAPAVREILHVSYDPTRALFAEINPLFEAFWLAKTNTAVKVLQSHGGSGKQARAVLQGLEADIVSLALAYDVDAIAKGGLLASDWRLRQGPSLAPFTSTVVLVVRQGNPKAIRDWDDLLRDEVRVVTPNPKTSGGARWNYLAAYGYALAKNAGDQRRARDFVTKLYRNVRVLDQGARGASVTFAERGIGDVLITWENEAQLLMRQRPREGLVVVLPSLSILAEPVVAVVDSHTGSHHSQDVTAAYRQFLYQESAQKIIARHGFRPIDQSVFQAVAPQFPPLKLFTIDAVFGGWDQAHREHFADGGLFDKIYEPGS